MAGGVRGSLVQTRHGGGGCGACEGQRAERGEGAEARDGARGGGEPRSERRRASVRLYGERRRQSSVLIDYTQEAGVRVRVAPTMPMAYGVLIQRPGSGRKNSAKCPSKDLGSLLADSGEERQSESWLPCIRSDVEAHSFVSPPEHRAYADRGRGPPSRVRIDKGSAVPSAESCVMRVAEAGLHDVRFYIACGRRYCDRSACATTQTVARRRLPQVQEGLRVALRACAQPYGRTNGRHGAIAARAARFAPSCTH